MTDPVRVFATRAAFVVTISLNAFLLFLIEPLFGKMALPHVGGNAAVWTTCMLFYQAALVGGYLYAHALSRIARPRVQAVVHVGLLLLALATLPVHIPPAWAPANVRHPEVSLGWLLTVHLSAPFVLLAAGSPLIQHWSAVADSSPERDPYSLYAASNVGSFAALIAYPTVFELWFGLRAQANIWTAGYGMLLLSIACCAVWTVRGSEIVESHDPEASSVSPLDRIQWLLLAAAPSSLLLGVTTHITTDLVPVPLLWVFPLALYLATFVIAFAKTGRRVSKALDATLPYLVLALAVLLFLHAELPGSAGYAAHLVVFFACALACHVRLATQRPATPHLTEFYLWVSLGGALGGVFNVVVAPNVFRTVAEYPIALVAAAALARASRFRPSWSDLVYPAGILVIFAATLVFTRQFPDSKERLVVGALLCVGGVVAFTFRERPLRFALAVGAIIASAAFSEDPSGQQEFIGRSFYGVYRVVLADSGRTRRFYSGTTVHGSESLNDPGTTPLTYYHRDGPLGTLFDLVRPPDARWRVGVIGLGVGSTAAYARAGEQWTFFEIDPLVASIAEDPRYFRFLSSSKAHPRIVLGDARLSLGSEPAGGLDLLLVDAFSSDAIPVHLITREALALYRSRLAPDGMIAWHISNRSLDLRPVLVALARDTGLDVAICDDTHIPADSRGRFPSIWVVMGNAERVRAATATDARWSTLNVSTPKLWTDDFSNILGVLR